METKVYIYNRKLNQDEKELLQNNCCHVHQMPCVARKEDNYFFALSKYQKPLEEILSQNPRFVQPLYRLNEVQSWIKSGLKDFSISRALLDRGIPVPDDNKQTKYVWFDALLGKDCSSLARPSLSCQSREGIPSNPDTSLVYQIYLSPDKSISCCIEEVISKFGEIPPQKGTKRVCARKLTKRGEIQAVPCQGLLVIQVLIG